MCGNQIIDAQHQSLFERSNELLSKALMISSPYTEYSEIAEVYAIIARMLDDVRQHFQDEERILEAAGFPGIQEHAKTHTMLLNKALQFSEELQASKLSVGDVFQFLAYDVVLLHMLGADQEFFPFIKNTGIPLIYNQSATFNDNTDKF
ncbi:MAG: hemerythrin family protein [Desulfamplus sp.]|nr:hemerythrin family protein [Desulfamplus sp.]